MMTTVIVASENVKDWLIDECGMTAEETGIDNSGAVDDATLRDLRGQDPPDVVTSHRSGDPMPVAHLGELCDEFTDLVTELRGAPPEEVLPHADAPRHNASSKYEQQNCRFSYDGDELVAAVRELLDRLEHD